MRYSISPDFARVQRAHAVAYAAHDAFAAAGEDETICGKAASAAEYEALDRMMQTPAQAPGDVLAKLRVFLDREMYGWNGPRSPDAATTYRAILEADLLNLNRPCVSSQMAEAFATWASAWVALQNATYDTEGENAGNLPVEITDAESAASVAIFKMPCAAAGDFIVKEYLNEMFDEGGHPDGYPFLIKDWLEGENLTLRDLQDCDLGRCLLALGRTDFDAEAWLDGMENSLGGQPVSVVYQSGGGMLFGINEPDTAPEPYAGAHTRYRLLQYLINGGDGNDRRMAVVDHILAERPDLVFGKKA